MSDKPLIVVGLAIALVVLTVPFWYAQTFGQGDEPPQPDLPEGQCVEEDMRANHMDLLDRWRDAVVRDGEKMYESSSGQSYVMSLTKTCLGCHGGRESFCMECHEYANVRPTCWECHVERIEN